MSGIEEGEENTASGNDWEVVSLTASAYAASPGPKGVELKDDEEGATHYEAETSQPLLMSRHFTLSSSELEIRDGKVNNKVGFGFGLEEEDARTRGKEEGDLTLKRLDLSDEFAGLQFLDEKGKREESIYSAAISSLHVDRAIVHEENEPMPEQTEPRTRTCVVTDISPTLRHRKDEKREEANIRCEAWWRRSAATVYAQAKEASSLWSVFIAAAVVGLVILGQQWQQERWSVLQLKWKSSIGNEVVESDAVPSSGPPPPTIIESRCR